MNLTRRAAEKRCPECGGHLPDVDESFGAQQISQPATLFGMPCVVICKDCWDKKYGGKMHRSIVKLRKP